MTRLYNTLLLMILICINAAGQETHKNDSLPRRIPDYLSPQLFIPSDRLNGYLPWNSAPLLRPVFHILPVYGFDGKMGFGEYSIEHPDKFFSTLTGDNHIDVPQLYVSEQKLVGNTLRLGRKFYFMSGILYGIQMGVIGNRWGIGTREGFIYRPSEKLSISFWQQYFGSIAVYSPLLFPPADNDPSAIKLPATPEVFTVGVQASFIVGEFVVGVGLSVAPLEHHEPKPLESD